MKTTQKVVYHGTWAGNVDSILQKGLIPGKSNGSDCWAFMQGMSGKAIGGVDAEFALASKVRRPQALYFTNDLQYAKGFAYFAAAANSKPHEGAIFRLELPPNFALERDEALSDIGFLHNGPIPAQFITGLMIGKNNRIRKGTAEELLAWPESFNPIDETAMAA